jgi:hypothetical protein
MIGANVALDHRDFPFQTHFPENLPSPSSDLSPQHRVTVRGLPDKVALQICDDVCPTLVTHSIHSFSPLERYP